MLSSHIAWAAAGSRHMANSPAPSRTFARTGVRACAPGRASTRAGQA